MIKRKTISIKMIDDFFQSGFNSVRDAVGIFVFDLNKDSFFFDKNSISILKLGNVNPGIKYQFKHIAFHKEFNQFKQFLIETNVTDHTEYVYKDSLLKGIRIKLLPKGDTIECYVISIEVLLQTERELKNIAAILESGSKVFSVVTWWKDYDQYTDYFFQTDDGPTLLGVDIHEDKIYSVKEFQKVRDRAAQNSGFYDECIKEEFEAFRKAKDGETEYFGGRTPAFNVSDEEVWVESYGIVLMRYQDNSPRFIVAFDIYLSDFFEKSNELTVLNSLMNTGLLKSDVGLWYYQNIDGVGKYSFTDSHRHLMRLEKSLTNENISAQIDDHFRKIINHTPDFENILNDWRMTHSRIFSEDVNSYTKIIPNNINPDIPQWVEVRGSVIERNADGSVRLFVGLNIDVTETVNRNRELERLRQENERLQLAEKLAVKAGNVLVWYQDFTNDKYQKYIYGNEMFDTRLGIERDKDGMLLIAALRKTIEKGSEEDRELSREFISGLNSIYTNKKDKFVNQLVKHKNKNTGEIIYFEHSVEIEERFEDGSVKVIGGYLRDVTERIERQKEIVYLANNDLLTGLSNRNYFDNFVNNGKLPEEYSVLLFDLDGLKLINDAFGHLQGDRAIKVVAGFLKEIFVDHVLISRIGGDEFLVISNIVDPDLITERANILEAKLEEYNAHSHIELNVSKGGYVLHPDKDTFESAFTQAENLMYRRKLLNRSSRKSKVLESILETLNAKTEETLEHSERLQDYIINISTVLGMSRASDLDDLRLLSRVHDIGKITIPDYILNKAEKLNDAEYEIIKKHCEAGYKIIKNITDSDQVCDAVLSHHERFDGKGYPQGLKGKDIPLYARIIAVADSYDAMTSDRVYHKAMTKQEAIEEIVRCSGTQFDPDIVQAFLKGNFNIDLK
jgi:diguanylate cyclase (GGDEF)-like protein